MCGVLFTVTVLVLGIILQANTQEVLDGHLSIVEPIRAAEETARLAALGAELEEELRVAEGQGEGSIPGQPELDYPVYTRIPHTSFTCGDKQFPGYYVDVEARCQAFHICETGGAKHSFLCPSGSIFSQKLQVCDWWYSSDCPDTDPYSLRLYHQEERSSQINQLDFSLNEAYNEDLLQQNNYVFIPSDIFHGAETGVPNRDRTGLHKMSNNTNEGKTPGGSADNSIGSNNQQEFQTNYSHQTEKNSNKLEQRRGYKKKNQRKTVQDNNGLPFIFRDVGSTSSSNTLSNVSDQNNNLNATSK